MENGMIVGAEKYDPQARDEKPLEYCPECGAALYMDTEVYCDMLSGEIICCENCAYSESAGKHFAVRLEV